MVEQANKNGVSGVRRLEKQEVLKLEPNINEAVLGGIYVPGECAVDPFLTPVTMLHEARRSGAEVKCSEQCDNLNSSFRS